jgi:hypothetical protein
MCWDTKVNLDPIITVHVVTLLATTHYGLCWDDKQSQPKVNSSPILEPGLLKFNLSVSQLSNTICVGMTDHLRWQLDMKVISVIYTTDLDLTIAQLIMICAGEIRHPVEVITLKARRPSTQSTQVSQFTCQSTSTDRLVQQLTWWNHLRVTPLTTSHLRIHVLTMAHRVRFFKLVRNCCAEPI